MSDLSKHEVAIYLSELKNEFDPASDEYADISQTLHYIELYR